MRHVTTKLDANPPADLAGILDDLDEATPLRPGPACGVSVALERIAEQDKAIAEKVAERVDDKRYPATKVAQVLAHRTGVDVQDQTVRRHRRRGGANGCRCAR